MVLKIAQKQNEGKPKNRGKPIEKQGKIGCKTDKVEQVSTLYNRVLGCGVCRYMGKPKTRPQRIVARLRAIHGDTLPRHRQRDSPGTASRRVSPAQRLSDALRAQERRRGAEILPERPQRDTVAHSVPHSPTAAQGRGQAHRPRTAHRTGTGAQIVTGTAHGAGAHRQPHRGSQNAPKNFFQKVEKGG